MAINGSFRARAAHRADGVCGAYVVAAGRDARRRVPGVGRVAADPWLDSGPGEARWILQGHEVLGTACTSRRIACDDATPPAALREAGPDAFDRRRCGVHPEKPRRPAAQGLRDHRDLAGVDVLSSPTTEFVDRAHREPGHPRELCAGDLRVRQKARETSPDLAAFGRNRFRMVPLPWCPRSVRSRSLPRLLCLEPGRQFAQTHRTQATRKSPPADAPPHPRLPDLRRRRQRASEFRVGWRAVGRESQQPVGRTP